MDLRPVTTSTLDRGVHVAFDRLTELAGVRPIILAEIDDMAMLGLFARESHCLALVPPVVVWDELMSGALVEHYKIPKITERFYAITQSRCFPNPLVQEVLAHQLEEPADWAVAAAQSLAKSAPSS